MRKWVAACSGLVLLAGCVAPATSPSVAPDASSSATVGVNATASATTARATVVPADTAATTPDYSGPTAMPAGDGGSMLWPTSVSVTLADGSDDDVTLHGFVDITGRLVVPVRYQDYDYCHDAAGRVAFVLAKATGRKADVLDLSGAVIGHAPTAHASCGPTGEVVFSQWVDAELGKVWSAIMDARSGKVLLPLVTGRKVSLLNDSLVNVSESKGEYFLDPATGKRTPHPGWIAEGNTLAAGAPGVVATTRRDGGRYGYVGPDGRWVVQPDLAGASDFVDGFAAVQLTEDRSTFLDAGLHRVGGEWTGIDQVYGLLDGASWTQVGYVVTDAAGKQALLGPDLRVIVPIGDRTITCSSEADGACSVLASDGHAQLVLLPQGTVTDLPGGFTQAVGRTFVADRVAADDTAADDNGARTVLAPGGGTVELGGVFSCSGVGAFALCQPQSAVLPNVVIDAQGRRTAFATVAPVPGAGAKEAVVYYWVTAGRYQGFVDPNGQWYFRQSRYTRLED